MAVSLVTSVDAAGPAAAAGVRAGDVVLGVNGERYLSHAHTAATLKHGRRPVELRLRHADRVCFVVFLITLAYTVATCTSLSLSLSKSELENLFCGVVADAARAVAHLRAPLHRRAFTRTPYISRQHVETIPECTLILGTCLFADAARRLANADARTSPCHRSPTPLAIPRGGEEEALRTHARPSIPQRRARRRPRHSGVPTATSRHTEAITKPLRLCRHAAPLRENFASAHAPAYDRSLDALGPDHSTTSSATTSRPRSSATAPTRRARTWEKALCEQRSQANGPDHPATSRSGLRANDPSGPRNARRTLRLRWHVTLGGPSARRNCGLRGASRRRPEPRRATKRDVDTSAGPPASIMPHAGTPRGAALPLPLRRLSRSGT